MFDLETVNHTVSVRKPARSASLSISPGHQLVDLIDLVVGGYVRHARRDPNFRACRKRDHRFDRTAAIISATKSAFASAWHRKQLIHGRCESTGGFFKILWVCMWPEGLEPLRGLFSSAGLGTLTHEHASTYLHLLGLAVCRHEHRVGAMVRASQAVADRPAVRQILSNIGKWHVLQPDLLAHLPIYFGHSKITQPSASMSS
jgi:hypothetical protein